MLHLFIGRAGRHQRRIVGAELGHTLRRQRLVALGNRVGQQLQLARQRRLARQLGRVAVSQGLGHGGVHVHGWRARRSQLDRHMLRVAALRLHLRHCRLSGGLHRVNGGQALGVIVQDSRQLQRQQIGEGLARHIGKAKGGQRSGQQFQVLVHGMLRKFRKKSGGNRDAGIGIVVAIQRQHHRLQVLDHGARRQASAKQDAAVRLLLLVVLPCLVVLGAQVGKAARLHRVNAKRRPLHQAAQPAVLHRQLDELARRPIAGPVRHVQEHILPQHARIEVLDHLLKLHRGDLEIAIARVREITRPGNRHPRLPGPVCQLDRLRIEAHQSRRAAAVRREPDMPPIRAHKRSHAGRLGKHGKHSK